MEKYSVMTIPAVRLERLYQCWFKKSTYIGQRLTRVKTKCEWFKTEEELYWSRVLCVNWSIENYY